MRTRSVVPAGPRTHSTDLSAIRTRHFGQMGASFSTDANTENPRAAVQSADFAASIISKSNQIRVIKEISSEPVAKRVARQEFPDSAACAHSTVENSLRRTETAPECGAAHSRARRAAGATPSSAGAGAEKLICLYQRARRTVHDGRLCQNAGQGRGRGKARVKAASACAAACVRVCLG